MLVMRSCSASNKDASAAFFDTDLETFFLLLFFFAIDVLPGVAIPSGIRSTRGSVSSLARSRHHGVNGGLDRKLGLARLSHRVRTDGLGGGYPMPGRSVLCITGVLY